MTARENLKSDIEAAIAKYEKEVETEVYEVNAFFNPQTMGFDLEIEEDC